MEQMLVGGYTLDELKKIQAAVKKDASKIISDAIANGTALVEELLTVEVDEDEAEEYSPDQVQAMCNLAKKAGEQLELAQLVSSVSGVQYYLEFNNNYDSNYDALSTKLNEKFEEDFPDGVDVLASLIEDMEGDSYMWHNSNC